MGNNDNLKSRRRAEYTLFTSLHRDRRTPKMGKIIWIVLLGFCLLVVQAKTKGRYGKSDESNDEDAPEDDNGSGAGSEESEEGEEEEEAAETKEFQCNLKYKRIGCYADKGKKDKPLVSFMESDDELSAMAKRGKLPKGSKGKGFEKFNGELPKFACKCANDAINGGNAIFGLQNLAECWSGPDDSKYDKDGPSDDCVSFNMAKCEESAEVCAGKKHANFVYFVDSAEHTKTQEEEQQELAEEAAKKPKSKKGKKAKKGKKSKKH